MEKQSIVQPVCTNKKSEQQSRNGDCNRGTRQLENDLLKKTAYITDLIIMPGTSSVNELHIHVIKICADVSVFTIHAATGVRLPVDNYLEES
jgi:hypothetical protein